jgi:hypothetical protein
VYIARIAILEIVITLSISRKHYRSYVLSNTKKIGSVVDLGAYRVQESALFWPPRGYLDLRCKLTIAQLNFLCRNLIKLGSPNRVEVLIALIFSPGPKRAHLISNQACRSYFAIKAFRHPVQIALLANPNS